MDWYSRVKSITDRCAQVIDTTWHFSQYWEHYDGGVLNLTGLKHALADCINQEAVTENRLTSLRELEKSLRRLIAEGERTQSDES